MTEEWSSVGMMPGEVRGVAKLLNQVPADGLVSVSFERRTDGDLYVRTYHKGKEAERLRHAGRKRYYIGPRGRVEEQRGWR